MNNKLCPTNDCTACYACLNACNHNAIKMIENSEGFYYPIIDKKTCVSCGFCTKVCPQIKLDEQLTYEVQECYAAFALNNNIRCSSSSGGVFSVLANYVLENKGKVIGAYLDQKERILSHIIISKKEDLSKLVGSKYVQSNIGYIYRQIKNELKSNNVILFCGTPCQVSGLKMYLRNIDTTHLITCDFICHGVPSYKVFKKMMDESNIKGDVFFRNIRGWNIGFYEKIKFYIGHILIPRNENESFYFYSYLSGFMNRECCYKCKYTNLKRVSDITLADFWGIQEKWPLTNKKMRKGVSFVGINTLKGKHYFEAINSKLFIQKRTLSEAIKNNDQLNHPCKYPEERLSFYKNLKGKTWKDLIIYYKYKPNRLSFLNKLRVLKNIMLSYKIR